MVASGKSKVGVGVIVGVGVMVGVGVIVGVSVMVGVDVFVGVGEGVCAGVSVSVGVELGVGVRLGVRVSVELDNASELQPVNNSTNRINMKTIMRRRSMSNNFIIDCASTTNILHLPFSGPNLKNFPVHRLSSTARYAF